MCFTPFVSISTAIIEFILATILLLYFPKTTLRNFSAILIYFLGFYQFTEFMLCISGNPIFWARLGFVTYSFLPAIALNSALRFVKRKPHPLFVYIIPFFVAVYAFSFPIVISATCKTVFVEVHHSGPLFNTIIYSIYDLYYFGFVLANCILFYLDFKSNKNKIREEIDLTEIWGVLLMTLPTIVFIILFPYLGIRFPSVLCGFAIFMAITSFIAVHLESKLIKRKANANKRR